MEVVIVCEFGGVEKVTPIVLLVVAKHADVCFDPFVIVLDLSLGLRVVSCRESLINVEGLEEASGVISRERGASIRIVHLGDSV